MGTAQLRAAAQKPLRLATVDVLRGLSILAVILLHLRIRFFFAGLWPKGITRTVWGHLLFTNGNNGVTIFFAISGFLITLTSIRRFGGLQALRPRVFYRIRFARIAPLLLTSLAILSVLHLLQVDGFVIRKTQASLPLALLAALTFTLNWLEAARGYLPANWDVLWSLSVEELFYLCFPLVCFGLLRLRRVGSALWLGLMGVLVIAGPFARALITNEIWNEKSYLGGMDGIALGCLSAVAVARFSGQPALPGTPGVVSHTPRVIHSGLLLMVQGLGAAMIALILFWPTWHHIMAPIAKSGLDGTMLAGGTALVAAASTLRGTGGLALTAPLRWIGRHSYELYMTHEFLVIWGTQLAENTHAQHPFFWVTTISLLCLPLAALVARFLSEPANRWLRGGPLPENNFRQEAGTA